MAFMTSGRRAMSSAAGHHAARFIDARRLHAGHAFHQKRLVLGPRARTSRRAGAGTAASRRPKWRYKTGIPPTRHPLCRYCGLRRRGCDMIPARPNASQYTRAHPRNPRTGPTSKNGIISESGKSITFPPIIVQGFYAELVRLDN